MNEIRDKNVALYSRNNAINNNNQSSSNRNEIERSHESINDNRIGLNRNNVNEVHNNNNNDGNSNNDDNSKNPRDEKYINKQSIIGFIIGILLIGIILVVSLPVSLVPYKNAKNIENIYSSSFRINTKIDSLTQFSFTSSQSYETTTAKEDNSPYIIYTKGIYELYTLNSSSPPKEEEKYYKTKYVTVINVDSFCFKFSVNSSESDCKMKSIFDLNKREIDNLRRIEEDEDLINGAILPLCIVEHTNNNLIISLTCPETLTDSLKINIIEAFHNVKPNSLNVFMFDNHNIEITNQEKDDKIYVDIYNNECSELNRTNINLMECNTTKNIITDKEGNLISSNKLISKNIILDENNTLLQNITYAFQNIIEANSSSFNPKTYKSNLEIILAMTSSIMKKEVYINNFTTHFMELSRKQETISEIKNLTNLESGIHEENIFYQTIFGIPIKLNMRNDIGFGEGQKASFASILNINNVFNFPFDEKQFQSNLNSTLKEIISITKGGNKLAHLLNINMKNLLIKSQEMLKENIETIIKFLPNKDLTEIFDSTLALKEINSLPYNFTKIMENLVIALDDLGNNIVQILDNTLLTLNNDIYNFLTDSHNLLLKISNNLTIVTNALNATENRICSIDSYYLNKTNTSYYNIINEYKDILDIYYKLEIDNILPIINNVYDTFYEKTMFFIQRFNFKLNNISQRLNGDNLIIISASSSEYNYMLNYIQNSKNKVNEIIIGVKNILNENIIKEDGYFETKEEIDQQIQVFEPIISKALNISYLLDNNEFIDTTFDNLMVYFRDNFLYLLKHIENFFNVEFPLEENVLNNSLFNSDNLKRIEELLIKPNQIIFESYESYYLKNLEDNVDIIIDEYLGNNLLEASYNYYNNKISNSLPKVLNNILAQWKIIYDDFYKNITLNKDYFKSSIDEFYISAYSYVDLYNKNISLYYINSVIDKLKYEFNYTNRYYYDMINSKVEDLCYSLLNNSSLNEKYIQINISCINMLEKIQNSKTEILRKNYQENTLNKLISNFFIIDNIINDHFNSFNSQLNEIINNIKYIVDEIKNKGNNPQELIIAKFYLESSISNNYINNIYDEINKGIIIDLSNNAIYNSSNTIWNNVINELIRNIYNSLNELNTNSRINFNNELEEYKKKVKDIIYNEFFVKGDFEEKLNSCFTSEYNSIYSYNNSRQKINDIVDSILNKIKYHLSKEADRLSKETTKYSNNYIYIKNRLENYKNSIYEQLYSIIKSKTDSIQAKIINKFYTNYIEKQLDELQNYFNKTKFGTAQYLNRIINLDQIINQEIKLLINEYKNFATEQINSLYQKGINKLDNIFSFSNIQTKINKRIDAYYINLLLPILNRKAIYSFGNGAISYYDFSSSIINDIDVFIEDRLENVKEIMNQMGENQYESNNLFKSDFTSVKEGMVNELKTHFVTFTSTEIKKENDEFNQALEDHFSDNFEKIVNSFIPSFTNDFYGRIIEFNEFNKLKVMYQNLKYSLYETTIYYLNLSDSNNGINLPINIKDEILTLNNIEEIIQSKNSQILSLLESKLEENIEKEKFYIAQRYKTILTSNTNLQNQFNVNITEKIKQKLNEKINEIETQYFTKMNIKVKIPIIERYTNALNKETESITYYINDYKNKLLKKLNSLFSIDLSLIIADIQNKVDNTNSSVDNYNKHLKTFKPSKDVINFFENKLIYEIIIQKYDELNIFLNKISIDYILNNLDSYSIEYKNNYLIENFTEKINEANSNYSFFIDKSTDLLNDYGATKEEFMINLQKEIDIYNYIRNVSDNKLYDIHFEVSFNDLKNNLFELGQKLKNFISFSQFEEKINNYIKEKNKEYKYSNYILNLIKNDISNYNLLMERLKELNKTSIEYYSNSYSIFLEMKKQIINNITEINELINIHENITYEIINIFYNNIKNKFKLINITDLILQDKIFIPEYSYYNTDNIFKIKANIDNYIMNYEFSLDIVKDENSITPNVIGNLVSNILPNSFNIDVYFSNCPLELIGGKIKIDFNNLLSQTKFVFDGKLNSATITTDFNFEKYSYNIQYYEKGMSSFEQYIFGIYLLLPNNNTGINDDLIRNENHFDIPSKVQTIIENYQY